MNQHADHSRSAAVRRVLDANLLRCDYRAQQGMLLTLAEQLEDELLASRLTVEFISKQRDEYLQLLEEAGKAPWQTM